ncbi:class I SAM-dependent methyltransferase [Candidatus Uhrbacteria bacterium]|nr:MAG: class I SAM-dependent methyltransferase [Candidatus Uhrbacteria bacterium]
MKLTRQTALKIHFILDQLLPPLLRDAQWFMSIPMRLLYKDRAHVFLNFKEKAWSMTEEEFAQAYRDVEPVLMERDTDLTDEAIHAVMGEIVGSDVLEAGCGKGVLVGKLSEQARVTATDIIISDEAKRRAPSATFLEANVEALPFPDRQFDTVVCTHTLEHVRDLAKSLSELRRLAKKKLVIVVPKQRPYRYTFDLHLHFFPYRSSLLGAFGRPLGTVSLREVGGDWLYTETLATEA